jgi:DNA polymerase III epsilon subunit-like protein
VSDGYLRGLDLVFVDTETGGLDKAANPLLSISVLRVDSTAFALKSELHVLVKPFIGSFIHPKAVEVNGFSAAKWREAIPEAEACERFSTIVEGAVWWGHEPQFDVDFMDAACGRTAKSYKLGWRKKYDTAILAWPLVRAGRIENTKLQTVAKALRIGSGEAHTAYSDAYTCMRVYQALVASYTDESGPIFRPPMASDELLFAELEAKENHAPFSYQLDPGTGKGRLSARWPMKAGTTMTCVGHVETENFVALRQVIYGSTVQDTRDGKRYGLHDTMVVYATDEAKSLYEVKRKGAFALCEPEETED